ncbi:MAG: polyphosphate polymerase domain-containing protein [Bacteroidales bacterium]|nr:polyphosphate polymerase domain-containing protein [Bacteroidales bacterium]
MIGFNHISFDDSLKALGPISLEEMDSIKLMNRIDSKYLTEESTLLLILADAAKAGYRVLMTEGERISPYDSIYYDTAGLNMFYDHHNRRLVRQKVRTREYVNSGDAFLEIKKKNNKGRTKKKRIHIPKEQLLDFHGDQEAVEFLDSHSEFPASSLDKVLETAFKRITLVNPAKTERLTIDTCLEFTNFRTGKRASLNNAVIIELKQDGRAGSQMKNILLDHRVKPARVSKYCIALTLTDPVAKTGRFKVKVRRIEKITGNKINVI